MSMFKFEDRICVCGKTWSALPWWEEYSVCGDCSSAEYQTRLATYSERLGFSVESIGGMCPTQAEGRYPDGRPYYFRARHGSWTLDVGRPDDPVGYGLWFDDGVQVARGDDPTHGGMDDDEVLAILAAHATPTPPEFVEPDGTTTRTDEETDRG